MPITITYQNWADLCKKVGITDGGSKALRDIQILNGIINNVAIIGTIDPETLYEIWLGPLLYTSAIRYTNLHNGPLHYLLPYIKEITKELNNWCVDENIKAKMMAQSSPVTVSNIPNNQRFLIKNRSENIIPHIEVVETRFKHSGLKAWIIEEQEDKIRFKNENGSESDWYSRFEFENETITTTVNK